MLSRVAERVYWLARYLERVENTARLINVHTALLMDMPRDIDINWFTLVSIFDGQMEYFQYYDRVDEINIMQFMLTEKQHVSSLLNSLAHVRENARTSIDILPEEIWKQVNELHLLVKGEVAAITNRRRRQQLLLKIMERCQVIWGIINNHMSRTYPYDFIQIGKHVERADMTSRILEMASFLISDSRSSSMREYEGILWSSLLKALSAQQMFYYQQGTPTNSAVVLNYLVKDQRFPRSIAYSLAAIKHYLEYLPRHESVGNYDEQTFDSVMQQNFAKIPANEVPQFMDRLQMRLSELNKLIGDNWFYPGYSAA